MNSAVIKEQYENSNLKEQIEINDRDLLRKEAQENSLNKQVKILRNMLSTQDQIHPSNNNPSDPNSIINSLSSLKDNKRPLPPNLN